MFKIKKVFIIFIFCFFLFIPNASAKYTISIDATCSFQLEIPEEVPEDEIISDPFMIYNLKDLLKFRDLQNNKKVDFTGKNVYLLNDIDLSEYYNENQDWIPIASEDNPFNGNFEGNSHNITSLKINNSLNCQGLFGQNNGTITKLNVYRRNNFK